MQQPVDNAGDKPSFADPQAPTGVRYQVLAGMCVLALITYIDRVCISRLKGDIEADLGFDKFQMGLVFGAFTVGYSLLEIPMGWWGDVIGPRRVLTRIVLCWSLFTLLTGLVWDIGGDPVEVPLLGPITATLAVMITVRFLFGAGEAGAFPNITRALGIWFPFRQRGLCQGLLWMSGRLGGAIAPVLVGLIAGALVSAQAAAPDLLGGIPVWRASFALFALLGVFWCLWFYPWFRDRPAEKSTVNEAERRLVEGDRPPGVKGADDGGHAGTPWAKLLLSGNLWCLCSMYFCGAYGWYVYITFLPDFLTNVHGVKPGYTEVWDLPILGSRELPVFDIMCGMPLGFGAIGCVLGGPLTDRAVGLLGWRWGRTAAGAAAMIGCGALLASAMHAPNVWTAMLLIACSTLVKDLYMAPSWAVCIDIGGRYSGTVAGFMNMTGNLGGVVAPILIGWMLTKYGETPQTWTMLFYNFAGANVIGGVFWLMVDPTRSVVEGGPAAPSVADKPAN